MRSTRSGGIPATAHFETACGETGGSKSAPIAAYEPIAEQISSKELGLGVSMPRIVNRQLTEINPQLLPANPGAVQHQLMVERMADRLLKLRGKMSLAAFGEAGGVSAQAAQKWFTGGDVKDASVEKLAARFGVTAAWIRYGVESTPKGAAGKGASVSALALDVAAKWMALSPDRQEAFRDMIFTTHWMENRFPAMKKGRPKGESYNQLEMAFERDMRQLKLFEQK